MLEQKVYNFIKKYNLIEDGDKIVLGVSGGPDSICMLNILNKISQNELIHFEIFVAHINHGLRENAIIDEEYVKEFCDKIKIPFFVEHAKIKEIAENEKRGLEETGRKIRYDFFDKVMEQTGSNKIAIAHNCNDNAETIIMNLCRGTGLSGLVGIKKENGKYIRPLIEIERCEIEEYLEEQNIVARHDESNDENIYTRNKIRNIVIPFLKKEFNPSIVSSLQRLSDIVEEEEEYFDKYTEKIYKEICINEINVTKNYEYNRNNSAEITIDLKKFNSLEKIIQKRIILYSIEKIFGTTRGIEKIHIEDIIKLCNNNIGNKYLTPNKNIKVVTQKKQLKIISLI